MKINENSSYILLRNIRALTLLQFQAFPLRARQVDCRVVCWMELNGILLDQVQEMSEADKAIFGITDISDDPFIW